ncbi:hypothetical protein GCM10027452_44370 [Micromonospora halotolerans]
MQLYTDGAIRRGPPDGPQLFCAWLPCRIHPSRITRAGRVTTVTKGRSVMATFLKRKATVVALAALSLTLAGAVTADRCSGSRPASTRSAAE